MRKDEVVKKNISLVFDFLRYLTAHPELIERLPDGRELEFLDRDSPIIERDIITEVSHFFIKVDRRKRWWPYTNKQ